MFNIVVTEKSFEKARTLNVHINLSFYLAYYSNYHRTEGNLKVNNGAETGANRVWQATVRAGPTNTFNIMRYC